MVLPQSSHPDPLRSILDQVPEKFSLLESGIDEKLQDEYFELSEKLNEEEPVPVSSLIPLLVKSNESDVKHALIRLAHIGTAEAYKAIESFMNEAQGELEAWAVLALQECRMNLESMNMEETAGSVATGLGGTSNRVRYFVAVPSLSGSPFTNIEQKTIKEEFALTCRRLDSILEKTEFELHYAALTLLIPFDVSLENLIKHAVSEASRKEKFISDHYLATNAGIPPKEEILRIFKEVEEKGKGEEVDKEIRE